MCRGSSAWSAAIPEADIRATAIGYIACQGGRLLDGSVGGRAIDRMYPITEEIDGAMVTLAYGVAFEPEGWVIVTADDRFDPVLGFSAEGRFRPEILADGSALSLTDTTFSMTIANPVKGAYYTVFTSTSPTGTFTAEKSVPFDSDAATFALEIDADAPTKFAKVVISLEAFEIGAPLP